MYFSVTLCHIVSCIRRIIPFPYKFICKQIMEHQELAMQELRKGPWLEEEDERLIAVVSVLGQRRWDALAKASGLKRSGKSCRLRWMNYLRPNLKHGHITAEEENLIIQLHKQWGNRWSRIARRLPGRTDNEIKNYWRSHLRKKTLTLEPDAAYSTTSLNNGQCQNSSRSMNEEAVSPCSSNNEEWIACKKRDNNLTSDAFDLSRFELSYCSSPYETRLITDWISKWSPREDQTEETHQENVNFCPPELISGYGDSDSSIWDGPFSIWDMD